MNFKCRRSRAGTSWRFAQRASKSRSVGDQAALIAINPTGAISCVTRAVIAVLIVRRLPVHSETERVVLIIGHCSKKKEKTHRSFVIGAKRKREKEDDCHCGWKNCPRRKNGENQRRELANARQRNKFLIMTFALSPCQVADGMVVDYPRGLAHFHCPPPSSSSRSRENR